MARTSSALLSRMDVSTSQRPTHSTPGTRSAFSRSPKPMLLQPMSPTRTLSFAEEVGFAADDRGADKIPDRPTPATNRDESERNCRREDLDLLISSGRPLTKVLSK